MKKCLLVVLILAAQLYLSGFSVPKAALDEAHKGSAVLSAEEPEDEPTSEPVQIKLTGLEIFDDSFTVDYLGFKWLQSSGLMCFDITVKNNSDEDVVLRLEDCYINGQAVEMIEENNALTVGKNAEASSSGNNCFTFDIGSFLTEGAALEDDIMFSLYKLSGDSKEKVAVMDYSKYEDVYIEFRGISEDFGWGINLYTRNDSDSEICLCVSQLEINGMSMSVYPDNVIVSPGEELLSEFTFNHEHLVYSGIKSIEEVSFLIQNYGDTANRQRFAMELALPEELVYAQNELKETSQIILDEENIRIECLGIRESYGEWLLDINIDNSLMNYGGILTVRAYDILIDGYLLNSGVSNSVFDVPCGEFYSTAGNRNLVLNLQAITDTGLSSIGEISFTMSIDNNDSITGERYYEIPVTIAVNKDIPEHYLNEQKAIPPVQEVFLDEEDVLVEYLGMTVDKNNVNMNLSIHNKRASDITFSLGFVGFNGSGYEEHPSERIIPSGAKYLVLDSPTYSIGWDDLEQLGIDAIESMDFKLAISESESKEEIVSKDISLSFEEVLKYEHPGEKIIVTDDYTVRFVDVRGESDGYQVFSIELFVENKRNTELFFRADNISSKEGTLEIHESYSSVWPEFDSTVFFNVKGEPLTDERAEQLEFLSFDLIVSDSPTGTALEEVHVVHDLTE